MDIKTYWLDFKKIFLPVLFTGLLALCSMLLGKYVEGSIPKWLFQPTWEGRTFAFFLLLGSVLFAFLLSVFLDPDRVKTIRTAKDFFHRLGFLLLTLLVVIGVGLLSAVLEVWMQTKLGDDFALLPLFGVLIFLIYLLSFIAYELRRSFQSVFLEAFNPRFLHQSDKGIGLILPLSIPKLPGHSAHPSDVGFARRWVEAFGTRALDDICRDIRAGKLNPHEEKPDLLVKLPELTEHSWAMMLLSLEWVKSTDPSKPKLIHFMASNDSLDTQNSSRFIEDAKHIAGHFGIPTSDSTVPFNDLTATYQAVRTILASAEWKRLDCVIDLTPGKKTSTFATGAASIHNRNCKVIYIDTQSLELGVWNPNSHDVAPNLST
jgi:hypothetical protein